MLKGLITKNISNLYVVSTKEGDFDCNPRGKFRHDKITPLVGDYVLIDKETKTIMEILERENFLERPSVANVKYALIVTSVKEPDLSLSLLDRLITRYESKNITPILIFTKNDLLTKNEKKEIKDIFKYYKKIGYKVCKNTNLFFIRRMLKGKLAFLVGQTGAGKSTLVNKLDKSLNVKTDKISKALGRGKHTTRHTEIYKISEFYLVDTPGFSSMNIDDIKKEELGNTFIEFRNYECKFNDCAHTRNCEITKAVENKEIRKSRYENYLKFYKEINESSSKFHK